MFMAITGTVWAGGSGAIIIGGLYWKRGTTAGAYAALSVGVVVGLWGLVADPLWQHLFGHNFPINGQYQWFIAMVSAILGYIIISCLTSHRQAPADLDRILHRGKHAIEPARPKAKATVLGMLRDLAGIQKEFTLTDRILATATLVWTFGWVLVFGVVTIIHYCVGTDPDWWARFWYGYLMLLLGLGAPAAVWLTLGGIRDIRALFRTLAAADRDPTDDGRVVHHQAPEERT